MKQKPLNPPPSTAVVYIRMPHKLHGELRRLAFAAERSVNQLMLDLIARAVKKHKADIPKEAIEP